MMAARRLGSPCLIHGIRIYIPHAESSRQAIVRDSLLRRRKELQWVQRHLHSSDLRREPSLATKQESYPEEEDPGVEEEEIKRVFRPPDRRTRESRRATDSSEEFFDFFPQTSPTKKPQVKAPWIPGDDPSSLTAYRPVGDQKSATLSPHIVSAPLSSPRFFSPKPPPNKPPVLSSGNQSTVPRDDPGPKISYPDTSVEDIVRSRLRANPKPPPRIPRILPAKRLEVPRPLLQEPTTNAPPPEVATPTSLVSSPSTSEQTMVIRPPVALTSNHLLEYDEFIEKATFDPVGALSKLLTLSPQVAGALTYQFYDRFFKRLEAKHNEGEDLSASFDPKQARDVLFWLCDPSVSDPALQITLHPQDETFPPEPIAIRTTRGFRFKYWLQLSLYLQCADIQRSVFKRLYPYHFRKGEYLDLPHLKTQAPIRTAEIVEILAGQLQAYRSWDTIIALFAGHRFPETPVNFPMMWWTPKLLTKVFMAFNMTNKPAVVPRLWEEYILAHRPLPKSGAAYNILMSAYLRLGDMANVRRYQRISREAGFDTLTDSMWESWHLLRAQRQFGMDVKLEEKTLAMLDTPLEKDVDKLDSSSTWDLVVYHDTLSAKVIHRLVRLRLDEDDGEGAVRLLHRFALAGLPSFGAMPVSARSTMAIAPTQTTLILAFEACSLLGMDIRAKEFWRILVNNEIKRVRDSHISKYVRFLDRRGEAIKAFRMISGYLSGTDTEEDHHRILPPGRCEIHTKTMNALVFAMSNQDGLEGLVFALELMQEHYIPMDDQTVRNILRCLSRPSIGNSADPVDLAATISLILSRANIPKSATKHVDQVMSRSIAASNIPRIGYPDPIAELDFQRPAFGLRPTEKLRSAVQPIVSDLTAKWLTTEPSAFAYRLEFEATLDTQVDGMSSARFLWNELGAKGYRMSKRHLLGLIKGYVAVGKMEAAESVLELAREYGLEITRGMWVALTSGYRDNHERARECYEEIRQLGDRFPGPGLDPFVTSQMINTYSHKRLHEQALNLIELDIRFEDMDDIMLRVVGMAYVRAGRAASAVELIEQYGGGRRLDERLVRLMYSARVILIDRMATRRASSRELNAYNVVEAMLARAEELERQGLEAEAKGEELTTTGRLLQVLGRMKQDSTMSQRRLYECAEDVEVVDRLWDEEDLGRVDNGKGEE